MTDLATYILELVVISFTPVIGFTTGYLIYNNRKYIMSKNSKSDPSWKKGVVVCNRNTSILINTSNNHVLCWAQPADDGHASWWPVEFKTTEAANDWWANGTISELSREISAPVEWRTGLYGPMPAEPVKDYNVIVMTLGSEAIDQAAKAHESASH